VQGARCIRIDDTIVGAAKPALLSSEGLQDAGVRIAAMEAVQAVCIVPMQRACV
jgi:hypothetical protein